MNRRDFIKTTGAAVISTSLLSACNKTKRGNDSAEAALAEEGEMTYRYNPNTGDKVSLLGFGMMRLPVEAGGTARENPDSPIDQDAVNRMVDYAIEHGVNYFDTSPAYCQGHSEESTGIALSRHPRSSYYIATKLSNFSPDTWNRAESQAMFERSLRYLQTDYVDYLLLHGVGMSGGGKDGMATLEGRYLSNGLLDWLVKQKQSGRIRNLGFSYHGDIKVFDRLLEWHDEGRYHWDFVQIELNYLEWSYASEVNPRNTDASYLYEELHKRGIMVVVMEPLLGGRLAKQPDTIMRRLQQQRPTASAAEWAFRFAGTPEGILTVLSGMTYIEHLQENVRTYSPLQPLTTEENNLLMQVADTLCNLDMVPCTACNYCMPCPYGLDIPGIFAHFNKCVAEGLTTQLAIQPTDRASYGEYKKARRKYLVSYDRAIPTVRQADRCIHCNHCVSHCPQRIQIPQQMQRISQTVERIRQS